MSYTPIRLCGMPCGGYPKGYHVLLSSHPTVENALHWGLVSGLASWTGPYAERAGYPPEGRTSRLWIEAADAPATLTPHRD